MRKTAYLLHRLLPSVGLVIAMTSALANPEYLPSSAATPLRLRAQAIEARVQQVGYPRNLSATVLAAQLTQGLNTDLEKLYAIYRWITDHIEYDAQAYFSGELRNATGADNTFARGKAVCDGYADLLVVMGRSVGLDIEKIEGYAKGYDHVGGYEYTQGKAPEKPNHVWNAVRLGKSWYLLDPTWDAGAIDKSTRQFMRNTQSLSFFLSDPTLFATTHFPGEVKWQLMDEKITFPQFLSLVELSPDVQTWKLDVSRHRQFLIQAPQMPYAFDFGQEVPNLSGYLERDGERLAGNWALHVRTAQGESKLLVAAPRPGEYDFSVHVQKNSSDTLTHQVLAYKIRFPSSTVFNSGFPTTFSGYHDKQIRLLEPLQGTLRAVQPISFKVQAPGASSVVLFQNGSLIKTLEPDGAGFGGLAQLQPGEVFVFAMYGNSPSFTGLLKYQVQ